MRRGEGDESEEEREEEIFETKLARERDRERACEEKIGEEREREIRDGRAKDETRG